jgi:UDP-glucose 4-epimerase
MPGKVLLTGGTGYIGSHTCVQLLDAGAEVVIIDNLSNSKEIVVERIEQITGKKPHFMQGDILDAAFLDQVLPGTRSMPSCTLPDSRRSANRSPNPCFITTTMLPAR